jgi:hypothetical protein
MTMYVVNRNLVVATTKGHRLVFKKDVPLFVPAICIPDVVAAGCTPADGSEPKLPERPDTGEPAEALDPTRRREALLDGVKKLVAKNDPDDFGADNAPTAKALSAVVKFKVDVKERNVVWQLYHDLAANGDI